jgi:hypothetical protein
MGNTNESFTLAYSIPGIYVDRVILSDFNNDGHSDLLQIPLAFWLGKIRYGKGDGTFDEEIDIDIGNGGTAFLGDFNGDGIADILNWNTGTDYGVFPAFQITIGNGDRTFSPPRTFGILDSFPVYLHTFYVVNANGDKYDDIWMQSNESDIYQVRGVWLNQYQHTSNINAYELYK